ncbi:hypothetical protein ACFVAJ_19290 [Agromyces sp. NPDC057679]|uniref:hypothetical protein n=1 Tax=Agromyces sp. NPDC057679 TaxID=3346207 RepID=UPI003672C776
MFIGAVGLSSAIASAPAGFAFQGTFTVVGVLSAWFCQAVNRHGRVEAWQAVLFVVFAVVAIIGGVTSTPGGSLLAAAAVFVIVAAVMSVLAAGGAAGPADVVLVSLVLSAAGSVDLLTALLCAAAVIAVNAASSARLWLRHRSVEASPPIAILITAGAPAGLAASFWFRPELVALLR